MNREEVQRRLDEAGRRPVPPTRAHFADSLETRLRAVVSTAGAPTIPPPHGAPTTRPWWRSPAAYAAASILVLLLAVGSVTQLVPPRTDDLRLTAAVDAVVTLADGTEVPAHAGLVLSDGAVVRTGSAGHVEVGGTTIGPRTTAVVRSGRLETVREDAAADSPPPSERPGPVLAVPDVGGLLEGPDRNAERPVGRPSQQPSGQGETSTEDAATGPPTTRPGDRPANPDGLAEDSADNPGERSATSAPTDQSAPERSMPAMSEVDDAHAISLGAMALHEHGLDGYGITWSEFRHPEFFAFVLLRAEEPGQPEWPAGQGTRLRYRTRDPEARRFLDQDHSTSGPVYRVIAVDAAGNELARSRAVAPSTEDTAS